MPLQQRHKLHLKIHLPMMRLLVLYIPHHGWHYRHTHAKRTIPLLPRKLVPLLVRPSRRIRLNHAHSLRQWQRRRNLHQKVRMIRHASYCMHKNPLVLADTRRIRPKPRPKLHRNSRPPLLRTKHNMHHILRVSMRQAASLSLLRALPNRSAVGASQFNPARQRWAKAPYPIPSAGGAPHSLSRRESMVCCTPRLLRRYVNIRRNTNAKKRPSRSLEAAMEASWADIGDRIGILGRQDMAATNRTVRVCELGVIGTCCHHSLYDTDQLGSPPREETGRLCFRLRPLRSPHDGGSQSAFQKPGDNWCSLILPVSPNYKFPPTPSNRSTSASHGRLNPPQPGLPLHLPPHRCPRTLSS